MNKDHNIPYRILPNELQNQIKKLNPYFGKIIGYDNWICYKSCHSNFCIRKHIPDHLCWPGGRYTN